MTAKRMKSSFSLKTENIQLPIGNLYRFNNLKVAMVLASTTFGGCAYKAMTQEEESYFSNYPYVDKIVVLQQGLDYGKFLMTSTSENFGKSYLNITLALEPIGCRNS